MNFLKRHIPIYLQVHFLLHWSVSHIIEEGMKWQVVTHQHNQQTPSHATCTLIQNISVYFLKVIQRNIGLLTVPLQTALTQRFSSGALSGSGMATGAASGSAAGAAETVTARSVKMKRRALVNCMLTNFLKCLIGRKTKVLVVVFARSVCLLW
jgi:hypothetical protein